MTDPITPATPAETLAGWKQRVANAYAKVFDAQTRSETALSMLSRVGVRATAKSEASGLTLQVDAAKSGVSLPGGTKAEQFTAEALAEMEALQLRESKRSVWHNIKAGAYRMQPLQVAALLDELGYREQDRPQETTAVHVSIDSGRVNTYGETQYVSRSFTLPGKVEKPEIKRLLIENFSPDNGIDARLRAVFPAATDLPDGAPQFSSSVSQQWPEFCEFDDQPES